jgi:hypothetical protein
MARYDQLLAEAKRDPETADFTALRMALTESPAYNPYGNPGGGVESRKALGQALQDRDIPKALELIGQKLDSMYLDAEMHLLAASLHKELHQPDEAAYHDLWFNGLMKSLLDSGNGLSFDSPITVISTSEEYIFLRVIGAVPGIQALREHAGHHFDVITARHPRTPEPMEFHFNIDIPFGWLEKHNRA